MSAPPVPTRLKTRQMVLLAHLDRERSLLHAAEAAGMSQPAASKLLRELEEALGVTLFERHARGVEPTVYGEVLMRRAHAVLSELHGAQEEVRQLQRGERYRIAIGSVMSPGIELLPQALALIEQRHPQLAVSVEMDTSRPLVSKLLEGRLDIVIGRILDPDDARTLAFEALAEEPHSLVARVGHPLASLRRRLAIEDLTGFTWALPLRESILRERLTAMFLQRGLPLPARVVETSSVPMITSLLRCSDMLVALPENVVRPYCDAGMLRILPIDLNVRMDAFGIITRRDYALSPDAQEALLALREVSRLVYPRTAAKPRT